MRKITGPLPPCPLSEGEGSRLALGFKRQFETECSAILGESLSILACFSTIIVKVTLPFGYLA